MADAFENPVAEDSPAAESGGSASLIDPELLELSPPFQWARQWSKWSGAVPSNAKVRPPRQGPQLAANHECLHHAQHHVLLCLPDCLDRLHLLDGKTHADARRGVRQSRVACLLICSLHAQPVVAPKQPSANPC